MADILSDFSKMINTTKSMYQSAGVEINWDLFNACTIVKTDDFYQRPNWYDQYDVYIYKTTKSTSIIPSKFKSATATEISCGTITFQNIDKHFGIHFGFLFSKSNDYKEVNWSSQVNDKSGKGMMTNSAKTIMYSSSVPILHAPDFKGSYDTSHPLRYIMGAVKRYFPLVGTQTKADFQTCDKKERTDFIYINYPAYKEQPDVKEICLTADGFKDTDKKDYLYIGQGKRQWRLKEAMENSKDNLPAYDAEIASKYQNAKVYTNYLSLYGYIKDTLKYPESMIKYVTHPMFIPTEDGGGYDCEGNPWKDDPEKESTLAPSIEDILREEKKQFYLLGQTDQNRQKGLTHRLYVFNGDGNDLEKQGNKLLRLKSVPCYENKSCKWVKTEPPTQDFLFEGATDDLDTNYPKIREEFPTQNNGKFLVGSITINNPNFILLNKFPACSINKGDDPKPPDGGGGEGGEGGGGDSGGSGGGGGDSGGVTPQPPKPFPPPDYPPCDGGTGSASPSPVSQVRLLKVPELTPTYNDTYDFKSKENQTNFFLSKGDIILSNYTYLRKDNVIMAGVHVDDIHCYNYLMYKNKHGKWYYCFIMNKEYINERTTRITIATDVVQTYLFDYTLRPSYVERCHVPRWKADGTPTDEFEPEGLEVGDPIQVETIKSTFKVFRDSYIAVCSNPLGYMPSRQNPEEKPKEVLIDVNSTVSSESL